MMAVSAQEAGNNLASFGQLLSHPLVETVMIGGLLGAIGAFAEFCWKRRKHAKVNAAAFDRAYVAEQMRVLATQISVHDTTLPKDHPYQVSLAGEVVSLGLTLKAQGFAFPEADVDRWPLTLGRWQRYFYTIGPLVRDGHFDDARAQAKVMSQYPYEQSAVAA